MADSDRRRYARFSIKAKVWVASQEDVHAMHILDLSLNGARVDTLRVEGYDDIQIGAEIKLLLFRTQGFKSLELNGLVVRMDKDGEDTACFGMDFSLSTAGARKRLEALLEENPESYPAHDHLKVD